MNFSIKFFINNISGMGKILFTAIAILLASNAGALDFYNYPESFQPNTVTIDIGFAGYFLDKGFEAFFPKMKFDLDYMLPVGLPFALGVYMEAPMPNLIDFGPRISYHINFDIENFDLYFLYCFNLGFLRNAELREKGYEPVEIRYFDFRGGIRYLFGGFMGVVIETGFHLDYIMIGAVIKLH
ncbi:hypothetical protein FACS1894190_16370 [Spirochaetia bacterium]|nr:hypothetical protein FACS1894190_16370 [Spirochaetia bacterium]